MIRNRRKRKVAVAPNEEKENETQTAPEPAYNNGPMYKIMSQVQTSEALHKKYVKEMQQLYTKMSHDAFTVTFIRMIKSAMECDETNEYALCSLQFCAKFIASYDDEETHPIIVSIFNWISQTSSNNPHIRFRLCQFVNLFLTALGIEAALDDAICDKILEYMIERLRDMAPSVRVQAIVAMQRLQVPDNPNDPVLRAYQFHLCSDPSPRVRQAVITCMGRNYITIPYILDRLWDIDEKVRRHTYLHMSSYPVRSYKVSQRLMLLEQGLNDRAEVVRKVVTKVMLRQWLESYQGNIVAFISALKLDANEEEIERFRNVTKQTLMEIFKSEERQKLIDLLPLDYEGEFHRCVPHENLTLEIAIYWQCLSDSFQAQGADELDLILPELSVFCAYVKNFCAQQKQDVDKFQRMEFQYKLLAQIEILSKYDLGDEIGRGNFQNLVSHLLKNASLDDKNVEILVRCAENLLSDQNIRMQFLIEIVQDLCQLNKEHNNLWNDRTVINEALANCADPALNLKLSELKVKILDLEEQEMVLLQSKNYVKAQEITEEKNNATEEYTNLLKPLLSAPLELRKVNNENILTALQIIFYMVVSDKVRSLSPEVCKLYNDFICRHIASSTITIRDWALKCGTAYAMHYEPIAKDLFNELYSQFFKHHNARIWETSVKCIFEIMDLYGVDSFAPIEQQSTNSKRTGRVLYNTLGSLDTDDEIPVSVDGQGVGVIYMMTHFLDTCDNVAIVSEIILGFIKLIVHDFIDSSDIIEKLLLRYFNPSTDNKIKQYLSIFLEEMIRKRKQNMLVPSLLPTLTAVFSAPYDSPLLDIRPETITRFFIDVTRQDACPQRNNNIHNKLAHSFLTEMVNNSNNKDLCKLLAKEILKLEIDVGRNSALKQEMIEMSQKLLASEFDIKLKKNISNFQGILNGTFNPPARNENDSEDDNDEDTTNQRSTITATAATTQVENATENDAPTTVLNDESESTLTPSQVAANVSQEENTQTNIEITEASDNNVESIGAVEKIPSSQSPANTATESQAQSSIVTPPPVTTFGRQNTVGQLCLRRSLNSSSRLQSESDISDTVTNNTPKIRIELRIDSEKKKAKTPEPQTKYKEKDISKKKTPKAITSTSGRTLRQLSTRGRTISPTPIVVPISDENSDSEKEANTSDVVPESPQPTRDTTRLNLPTRRCRVAQADKQAPFTEPRVSRKTKQIREESEHQPRSSPRQDFICRHIASSTITIRDWALKCGTAYAMHYEPIAKDLFNELYSQFFKHHNARIWETSVKCIFEIMDLYGVDSFAPIEQQSTNSKRTGRVLYNTLGSLDTDDEIPVSVDGQGVGVIYMMTHFLDTCDNVAIVSEIILGFIKLIVHDFIDSSDIIEKLLLRYFNPSTDNKIKQYLSIFLEEMIRKRKQNMLVPSLLPTLTAVFSAPYDSPLLDIRPETITRFFIDVTRQDACPQRNNNIHNKLAHSFLTEMVNNSNNKDLCKLLAKEILKLEIDVGRNSALKQEMIEMSQKLLASEFDIKLKKNISNFQGILNGTFNPPARNENDSEDDNDEDTTNQRSTITATAATTQVENATENDAPTTVLNDESESTLTPSQVAANVSQEENTQTNIEITEASDNNVESIGAVEKIPSSQSPANTATESQAQSSIVTPPPVTTFGRQNTVGQLCLRRSLNSSSRLQSESDISDTVTNNTPKIRIELRIDSEKKKAKTPEPQTKYKEKDISKKKTPKAITSTSGRTLRQLSTRGRTISPTPIVVPISDENSDSEKEANTSDVVPESPQPTRDTTRLNLPTRRCRVAQADKQAPFTEPRVSRKTKQIREESEHQPRSSPRQDFICRHIASSTITIRDWALKCGTAYAMHYEPIAKDLFNELYSQFFKHHNARIWETSVKCIFEIMDLYGVDSFAPIEQQSTNSKRTGRVLYNTLGSLDTDDEIPVSVDGQGVGVIYMMTHFLDTCDNVAIVSEIILGFIKLIVHDFIDSSDIIEKLLLRYFNPSTDNKIKQYLSIFLEEMIRKRKQNMLVPSLLPTLTAVFSAPYDSPLLDIRPETITRFFIDVTRQDACPQRNNNIHNKLAHSFLTEMVNNSNNKDLCKLLAKEILKLEIDVGRNSALKQEMIEMSQKLLASEFDIKLKKNISNFQGILNGTFNPPARNENDSEDDNDEDTTNQRSTITATAATTQVENATENDAPTTVLNDESESTLTPSQVAANVSQEENTQTNIEITEASDNNVESIGAVEKIPSSQSPANTATESQAQSSIVTPPPVTTFGRQNTVGQLCLRRSLNSSSRLQSESDISDTVTNNTPKIRIELRIDSEKKKAKTPEPQTKYKEKDISKKKTPKAITSTSGRTLRQLSTRGRTISPTPIVVPISDENSDSEKEANTSDVVPESPQPTRDTTRLNLPTRRCRVAQADKQAPFTEPRVSRKTKQIREESEHQPRSSPRQTLQQTTPTKKLPRKLLYSKNVSPLTVNSLKRSYPRTPYPKNKKTTSQTLVNSSSSSSSSSSSVSRSPRAKQARRSIFSKSPQQKKSTSENNSDSNEKSSSTDDKTPLRKRSRFSKILPYSTTKLIAKSQIDNEANRRKSASNIPANATTETDSNQVNCNSATKMTLRKRGRPLKNNKKASATPKRIIQKASEANTLRTSSSSVSNLPVQTEADPNETINYSTTGKKNTIKENNN